MQHRFTRLNVVNFRTLTDTELPLGPLNVLVGPNAAGKSNVLKAFGFLSDIARQGIGPTLEASDGYPEVAHRGGRRTKSELSIGLEGVWTEHATDAHPDTYDLTLLERRAPGDSDDQHVLSRRERFVQHLGPAAASTIELRRDKFLVDSPLREELPTAPGYLPDRYVSGLQESAGLPATGASFDAVRTIGRHISSVRIFDADVRKARKPSPIGFSGRKLANDARNIGDFLLELKKDSYAWDSLLDDVRYVVRDIEDIEVVPTPGKPDRVTVMLKERGLRGRTQLADASFGTVRLLCLLSLFHDPHPPILTCIEEIDHGLHPHALGLLYERLRDASERSQFLVISHSPVFADYLEPEELVICERDETGASQIPAIRAEKIQAIVEASEGLPLGKLWFSGTLGGDL
ncbi:AAA family ATPase [Kitasatospora sp. NPDC093806]|uniref:AAA family ATPase n=1 Tax=Kitasatospora sp. NPDC093806 TaxID=3155075 RepID=UPI00342A095F